VAQSYAQAFQWYLLAANQGHPESEYNIGLMYADGLGVDADPDESRVWLQRAAEHGVAEARGVLARMDSVIETRV